jgi:hypothetical protein
LNLGRPDVQDAEAAARRRVGCRCVRHGVGYAPAIVGDANLAKVNLGWFQFKASGQRRRVPPEQVHAP